jgi:hypothetical protein
MEMEKEGNWDKLSVTLTIFASCQLWLNRPLNVVFTPKKEQVIKDVFFLLPRVAEPDSFFFALEAAAAAMPSMSAAFFFFMLLREIREDVSFYFVKVSLLCLFIA